MSWAETLYLRKIIKGEKIFVGAETPVLAILWDETIDFNYRNDFLTEKAFCPKLDGTIMAKVNLVRKNDDASYGITIYEKNDGSEEMKAIGSASAVDGIQFIPFPVKKGSKYYVGISTGSTIYCTLYSIEITGLVLDSNYFKVE